MFLLWYYLIATSFFRDSVAHEMFQEVDENIDRNHRTMQLKNKKDDNIAKEWNGETPHTISNDEIWFDMNDSEEKDYEILDVEDVDEDLSHPSDERNYESLMNYIKQEKSIGLTSSYGDSTNELLTSEDFSSNEVDGMTYGTEGNDFDESERVKREIDAEDLPNNLDNVTYDGNDLQFRQGNDFKEYRSRVLQPNPYTSVYDYEYATPEREPREDRWSIYPCVTNLRELYTCIFCWLLRLESWKCHDQQCTKSRLYGYKVQPLQALRGLFWYPRLGWVPQVNSGTQPNRGDRNRPQSIVGWESGSLLYCVRMFLRTWVSDFVSMNQATH
ncbi:hypothetical protein AVEN_165974-1 [Araneus ventricosus]|uniref:Uncharacterized protein n=1 Tax=Araneus ventricosus TaxID=182803 RepID=A0A4Y2IFL3_ARAVE|nr:hypothetical protein AVEN_165974-1 [Araneus ventricosus]